MTYLSIIIPAYNEEKRIGATLDKIHSFFKTKNYDFEVMIVDDGSTDRTAGVVAASGLAKEGKLSILKNRSNRGKGFSVKNGILNSNGEYLLFTDADLSTPIEDVDKLLKEISKDYDIVIGSRALKDSAVMVHQSCYREFMGKVFNFFVKTLLIKSFNDTQCGFKLFKREPAREIAREMLINGFAFDVEMLYLAKIKGYKVKEAGVAWENSSDSRVKLFRSPINMFLDLFEIKAKHRTRKWDH